jgi:hypothetical protein
VGSVYRHHSVNFDEFLAGLEEDIVRFRRCLLGGDFNARMMANGDTEENNEGIALKQWSQATA